MKHKALNIFCKRNIPKKYLDGLCAIFCIFSYFIRAERHFAESTHTHSEYVVSVPLYFLKNTIILWHNYQNAFDLFHSRVLTNEKSRTLGGLQDFQPSMTSYTGLVPRVYRQLVPA